jgi:hypothetical protein
MPQKRLFVGNRRLCTVGLTVGLQIKFLAHKVSTWNLPNVTLLSSIMFIIENEI